MITGTMAQQSVLRIHADDATALASCFIRSVISTFERNGPTSVSTVSRP